jgi:hypothetical protein
VRRARRIVPVAVALGALAAAAGCGGDDQRTATVVRSTPATVTTEVPAPVPSTTTGTTGTTPASPASTSPSTTPSATTGVPPSGGVQAPDANGGTPAGGEQAPGGAGDEEAARVPATFTASGATLTPARITVPAFLPVDLSVTAKGAAQKVTIEGAGTLDVAAGATGNQRIGGLKPGDYAVTTAGGAKATLHVVSGGAPGP